LLVVVIAAVGGVWVAGASAVAAFLLVNYYFTPPIHEWTIAERENLVALIVFLLVAGVVSSLVTIAARRSLEAARSRTEAATLVELAGALMVADDPLPQIIDQLLATFDLTGASVLRRAADGRWKVVVGGGERIPRAPDNATGTSELPSGEMLAYLGPNVAAEDRRLLNAFVSQLAAALAARELRAEAGNAAAVAHADALRTALLRAVSHDLRTPLASIKAAATTLLADDLTLAPETVEQLHETIDEETDRLTELVNNLLAMSRLQAGGLQLATSDAAIDEVVGRALVSLGDRAGKVTIGVPDDLPNVRLDPALLERAVANVVANARAASPADEPIMIDGAVVAGRMILRIIDRGPGIPVADRERVFSPFQRLGDGNSATGVGLGLAVARGFAEAMGGELRAEDTPGGGTTMTFSFPLERP
jgi:two-component system sensor histidine kinase KdpD